jgi:hypothetical protein
MTESSHAAGMPSGPAIDLAFVRVWFTRYWLAIWFATISGITLLIETGRGLDWFLDARLYVAATRVWLDGGDPWQVVVHGLAFAAPPPTLLVIAPFALLPGDLGVYALALVGVAAAIQTVRLIGLPWWWLAFPPLVAAVVSGNIQTVLVPLLLLGAGPLAVFAKVYAVVPLLLLRRWRQLVVTALLLLLTVPFLPWGTFLGEFGAINAALAAQSHDGLSGPILLIAVPLALVGIVIIGPSRGAWLAVAAVWPSQQPYYGTLVMPLASTLVAALLIVPVPWSGMLALGGLAAWTLWERQRPVGAIPPGPVVRSA